jgi:hypothetical protein
MPVRFLAIAAAVITLGVTGAARAGAPLPIIVTSWLTGSPVAVDGNMSFPAQDPGATSPPQTETLIVHMQATQGGNPVAVPDFYSTTISNVVASPAGFVIEGGSCTTSPGNEGLHDGDTCTVSVAFAPTAAGLVERDLDVTCFVAEAVGVVTLACDNTPNRFLLLLRGVGLGGLANAIPALGRGGLTLLALGLVVASGLAMRRR